MKKRFLSATICATMAMSFISPIGAAASEDMVTVSLYIPALTTYSEDAVDAVESAMNEYLAENYGLQVDLTYIESGNFETSVNLAMTTDEVDITCVINTSSQLKTYAQNNQLLDITDYYENASDDLKAVFTDEEIMSSTVDGSLYALVRKYQYGGGLQVIMNEEIVEEMGIDPSSISDLDTLTEVLYQVQEAHPELNYIMVPQSGSDMMWGYPWDFIGKTLFAYADWGTTEVKSLFELDSFAELCSYTRQWYEDGLVMSDAISNTSEGTTLVSSGAAFCAFQNADIYDVAAMYTNIVTTDWIIEPHATSSDVGNIQYGISANSAHPDEAFTLLSALYTDTELVTLLAYGIEGEHYVLNEDGVADYPEGMDSTNEPYGGFTAPVYYPNYTLLPIQVTTSVDNIKTAVDEWNENVEMSVSYGFDFDTSDYTDFVTAYTNLEDKYKAALLTGSIALDDVLPSIQSELESIGFYEVIAEVQTQLDAYLAE